MNDKFLLEEDRFKTLIAKRVREFAVSLYGSEYGALKNLAEKADISTTMMNYIVKGLKLPGSYTLMQFLKLGCDLNWLLDPNTEDRTNYSVTKKNKTEIADDLAKLKVKLVQIERERDDAIKQLEQIKTILSGKANL